METRSKAMAKKLIPVVEKKAEEPQLPNVNCEIFIDLKQRVNAIKLKHEELLKLEKSLSEEVIMFRSKYFNNENILNTNEFCSCAWKNKFYITLEWNPRPHCCESNTTRSSALSHCEKCNRIHISDIEYSLW